MSSRAQLVKALSCAHHSAVPAIRKASLNFSSSVGITRCTLSRVSNVRLFSSEGETGLEELDIKSLGPAPSRYSTDGTLVQNLIQHASDWDNSNHNDEESYKNRNTLLPDPGEGFADEEVENREPQSDDELFEAPEDGQLLGPQWVYDNKNHVYYNYETQQIMVRKQESGKMWKERRAASNNSKLEIYDNLPQRDDEVAMRSVPNLLELNQLYPESEMVKIRQKYHWMNFKELNQALHDADRRFFQSSPNVNYLRFTANGPNDINEQDQQDRYQTEHNKFLKKMYVKYGVAQFRRVNMTRVGRVFTIGSLILVGNRRGWAGYGYGHGKDSAQADRRALDECRKNLVDVPLLEGRTIYGTVIGRYGKTKVIMKRMPRGHGIVGGQFMQALCECLGIGDLTTKIIGPRHPLHVAYAAFEGLTRTASTRRDALARGVNYYKMFEAGTEHEEAPTKEELTKQSQTVGVHIMAAAEQWSRLEKERQTVYNWGMPETIEGHKHNRKPWNLPFLQLGERGKKHSQPKWTPN